MKKTELVAAVATIATLNAEGFTVNAQTLQPITHGYAVAVEATQNSFGAEGLSKVVDYVNTHEEATAFGGWLDRETGLYYFDAVIIVYDFNESIDLARKNNQLAFFSLDTLKTYDQDGNEIKE